MASYYARKKGTGRKQRTVFDVKWRDSSGRQRSHTVATEPDARALATHVESNPDWQPFEADEVPTVDQILEAYVTAQRAKLSADTARIVRMVTGEFTAMLRERMPRRRLMPNLCFTVSMLEAFRARLVDPARSDGRRAPCSDLVANQRVRKIEQAWAWAANRDEYIKHVPRPRTLDDMPTGYVKLQPWAPDWATMDAVIDAASGWYRKIFLVARFTGLRKTQILRLLWSDVDLDRALLTVRPELGKSRAEKSGRVVPISRHFVAELATWGVRKGWLVDSGAAEKRKPVHATLQAAWVAVTGESPRQPVHSFRKGLSSGLAAEGISDEVRAALLGQRRSITSSVYTDGASLMPAMREAVAKIPALGEVKLLRLESAR